MQATIVLFLRKTHGKVSFIQKAKTQLFSHPNSPSFTLKLVTLAKDTHAISSRIEVCSRYRRSAISQSGARSLRQREKRFGVNAASHSDVVVDDDDPRGLHGSPVPESLAGLAFYPQTRRKGAYLHTPQPLFQVYFGLASPSQPSSRFPSLSAKLTTPRNRYRYIRPEFPFVSSRH